MSAAGATYARLPPAVEEETVSATTSASPDGVVKTYLLHVTVELLAIQAATNKANASSDDRYTPSLKVLHARLQAGRHSPFVGLGHVSEGDFPRAAQPNATAITPASDRPLGDFEDLYYAILATVKELHESVILRLNNGFVDPHALLFPSTQYTVRLFQEWLEHQWSILNEPSFVLALDVAVRKSLVQGHLCQGLRHKVESDQITHQQADVARAQLFQSNFFPDIPGLAWVGNEHPAMINGRLNEKYHVLFQAEKQAPKKKGRRDQRRDRIRHGPVRRQRNETAAGPVQRSVPLVPVRVDGRGPLSELKQAGQRCDKTGKSQQADETGSDTRSSLQDQVEIWRMHAQQHMSSQRDSQMQNSEDEPRRKTPSVRRLVADMQQPVQNTEQATASTSEDSLRESAADTPHRQVHPGTQPRIATIPQVAHDTSPSLRDDTSADVTASPADTRVQRVTEYQAWLRQSASSSARTLWGRDDQTQHGVNEDPAQTPKDMDMDMTDGGF